MTKEVVIDIETDSLNPIWGNIRGIGRYLLGEGLFKYDDTLGANIGDYTQIYQNGKFDINFLRHKGYGGMRLDEDTLLAASLLPHETGELSLAKLAKRYLKVKSWKVDHKTEVSDEELREHCKQDCIMTGRLHDYLLKQLKKENLDKYYYSKLLPATRMLMDMEYDGVKIDVELLKDYKAVYDHKVLEFIAKFKGEYKEVVDAVEKVLLRDAVEKCKPGKLPTTIQNRRDRVRSDPPVFNLNSNVHMGVMLGVIGVKVTDIEGNPTTSSKALPYYINDHPIIKDIIEYRNVKKLAEFLHIWDKCRVGDHIYPTFNIHVTRTGRLSSSNPNLQQVTSDLRELFIPHKGNTFVVVDYSQIEPRLTAHYSGDTNLIQVFKDDKDLYGILATHLLGCDCDPSNVKEKYPVKRAIAKAIVLAVTYGMGAKTLQYTLKYNNGVETTLEECKEYIKGFYKEYPKVKDFKYRLGGIAMREGFIKGVFGRKLWLDRDDARHKGLNYFIQNAASDLTLLSQLAVVKELEGIAKLRLLVHDEAVYETKPEDVEKVIETIQHFMVYRYKEQFKVPLAINSFVGSSWGVKE
jgi:DNA polymerase I